MGQPETNLRVESGGASRDPLGSSEATSANRGETFHPALYCIAGLTATSHELIDVNSGAVAYRREQRKLWQLQTD